MGRYIPERGRASKPRLRAWQGTVLTTPMQLKETEDFIKAWSKLGVLAVECETSTLLLLSQLEGIKSGVALTVTDSPIRRQTHILDKALDRRVRDAFDKTIKLIFEAMVDLIRQQPL